MYNNISSYTGACIDHSYRYFVGIVLLLSLTKTQTHTSSNSSKSTMIASNRARTTAELVSES